DVQAHLALDLADQTLDLPVLLLLQDRATKERERPIRGRVRALAPGRPDRAAHAPRVGSIRSSWSSVRTIRSRKTFGLYSLWNRSRARRASSVRSSASRNSRRIPPARSVGFGSTRQAISSSRTCVCVGRRVATTGRPESRYE